MKVLAVIALLAVVAYAWEEAEEHVTLSASSKDFVGELQDVMGGEILMFSALPDMSSMNSQFWGIPSCKLGPIPGNPICAAKCVKRGHIWGHCVGKVCTCS